MSLGQIVVTHLAGVPWRGLLRAGALAIPCRLGRSGIRRDKREGDGATPAGTFALGKSYWRADRLARPRTGLDLAPLSRRDGWCDDAASACYNRPVQLPFGARHECLWREDRLYDVVVTLDHNQRPRVRDRGSAVFLHVAPPGGAPTAGCVALDPSALRRLLPRLSPRTRLVIR